MRTPHKAKKAHNKATLVVLQKQNSTKLKKEFVI